MLRNQKAKCCEEVEEVVLQCPAQIIEYNVCNSLQNRVIWIDDEIGKQFVEMEKTIINWNLADAGLPQQERQPIYIFFYSAGGDLYVSNSFISVIKSSKTPVYGVNIGQCCSGACYIFMACAKRYALKNTTFLIHKSSDLMFSGTHDQVVTNYNRYLKEMDDLYQFVKENSAIPDEVLSQKFDTDWFFNEKEALTLGVCDCIVDSLDDVFLGDAYAAV